MGEIHVGDKVVVRLKEYFSGEGNYRVSYWLNEISEFNENEYEFTSRNRVKRTSISTSPEETEQL